MGNWAWDRRPTHSRQVRPFSFVSLSASRRDFLCVIAKKFEMTSHRLEGPPGADSLRMRQEFSCSTTRAPSRAWQ